jgi:hypothetical protein
MPEANSCSTYMLTNWWFFVPACRLLIADSASNAASFTGWKNLMALRSETATKIAALCLDIISTSNNSKLVFAQ